MIRDRGRTLSGPQANNLPAADSKLYAGRLSTGQRYLVWNWPPARDTLVVAVCAIEHDGSLHVIYTMLSSVPLAALA